MSAARLYGLVVAVLLAGSDSVAADAPQVIPVPELRSAPVLDGALGDWRKDGWTRIQVAPAVRREEREKHGLDPEDRNHTGTVVVEMQAGMFAGRIYLAVRWPDEVADLEYKGWEWFGGKYVENKRRDDAFAVRFHMEGDFDRSMLSAKTYQVDVWFWSAARTNPTGYAEDWTHRITTQPTENAAEYAVRGVGSVFIRKIRDAGSGIYRPIPRPKEKGAERLPLFEPVPSPSGSVADVLAKGRWVEGRWSLEMSRKLDTGHPDDVVLGRGRHLAQIAVFNRGSDENKSVSEPLLLDFPAKK